VRFEQRDITPKLHNLVLIVYKISYSEQRPKVKQLKKRPKVKQLKKRPKVKQLKSNHTMNIHTCDVNNDQKLNS